MLSIYGAYFPRSIPRMTSKNGQTPTGRIPGSHRRRPNAVDRIGFGGPGPWRHRHGDGDERLGPVAAVLEMRAGRDADRYARADLGNFLGIVELAPNKPMPGNEIPDLLDRTMRHRLGDALRQQRKNRETAAREAAQDAHLRAVRRDRIGLAADPFGPELHRACLRSPIAAVQGRGEPLPCAPAAPPPRRTPCRSPM